jgi:hypothetical protein
MHHHGSAIPEIWLARTAINAGNLTGGGMTSEVSKVMEYMCPEGGCVSHRASSPVWVPYVTKNNGFFPIKWGTTQLFILIDHMSFETDEIRRLLISTLTMVMGTCSALAFLST